MKQNSKVLAISRDLLETVRTHMDSGATATQVEAAMEITVVLFKADQIGSLNLDAPTSRESPSKAR